MARYPVAVLLRNLGNSLLQWMAAPAQSVPAQVSVIDPRESRKSRTFSNCHVPRQLSRLADMPAWSETNARLPLRETLAGPSWHIAGDAGSLGENPVPVLSTTLELFAKARLALPERP